MKKKRIKKLIACSIPISTCNLKCHYCYISQLDDWKKKKNNILVDPKLISTALSSKRLGGECIINLTGKGETLIPVEITEVIRRLLEEGHYLEVVTNGTMDDRFNVMEQFPRELLSRLEFKFSFHYLELLEKGWIDRFFNNVKRMRDAGCSFTVELMPNDEIIPYIEDIKRVCIENVGALCHLTIGRDDNDGRKILTELSKQQYFDVWKDFNSTMFDFKWKVFNVKRHEFCYAGMWTLYVNLGTGEARQCYGFKTNQNIYENMDKPLYFRPVGRGCKQPFCYNAHAFMTLGVIPEIDTPTYAAIRDRIDRDGKHWLNEQLREVFSSKLYDADQLIEGNERLGYYLTYPSDIIRTFKMRIERLLK